MQSIQKRIRLCLVLFFILCSLLKITNILANNTPELAFLDLFELEDTAKVKEIINIEEVVISAQIWPKKTSEAIHDIQLISRQKIDALGSNTLQNLLTQQFNMRLSQDNILGSNVSMQGVSGQNVKILVDGTPIIGRLNGSIDLSQINLNNIEKVEIIEGPLSVNYGTDALAGTINLISRDPNQINSIINCYYETVGQYNVDFLQSFSLKPHYFSLSGGRNYFDGWSKGEKINPIPIKNVANASRINEWKPKEQYFYNGTYKYRKKNLTIKSQYDNFFEKITNKGLPRDPLFNSAFDDYYKTWRKTFSVKTDYLFKKSKIDLKISYSNFKRIKNTFFKNLVDLSEVLSSNSTAHDTSNFTHSILKSSLRLPKTNNLETEIGIDINVETAQGKRIEFQKQSVSDYAIYSNLEWAASSKLIFRPGLRYSYNTNYNSPIIPSVNIKYDFHNIILRSSFAKGFRSPSLKEQFFNFVDINHNITGNKNLLAETSNNFQFSISHTLRLYNNSILKLKTSLFHNDIDQMITLALISNTAYQYINLGKYKTKGITTTLNFKSGNFTFSNSIAYFGRYSKISEAHDSNPFNYTLDYSSSIIQSFIKKNIILSLFFKHTGDLPSYRLNSEGEVQNSYIKGYDILDFTASKKLAKNINLSIGCKNIFNIQSADAVNLSPGVHQASMNSVSVAYGRTFFTSIKFNVK